MTIIIILKTNKIMKVSNKWHLYSYLCHISVLPPVFNLESGVGLQICDTQDCHLFDNFKNRVLTSWSRTVAVISTSTVGRLCPASESHTSFSSASEQKWIIFRIRARLAFLLYQNKTSQTPSTQHKVTCTCLYLKVRGFLESNTLSLLCFFKQSRLDRA